MATKRKVRVKSIIAAFMSASTPIEAQLLEGTTLSHTELYCIINTILGLQTSLEVWKRKNGMPVMPR